MTHSFPTRRPSDLLVRAISQNQRQEGYWGNTQENMFCANALADYAAAYESVTPDLQVTATLDDTPLGTAELKGVSATPVVIEHLIRSEEHTSELQSLMRISYAVFCLKKKNT